MIRVKVCLKNKDIKEVEIEGHANSGEHGQDLVCAGVSSIGVGMLNALNELQKDKCTLVMSEGYIKIESLSDDKEVQNMLQTLYIQLLSMEEVYGEYIKIVKVEV